MSPQLPEKLPEVISLAEFRNRVHPDEPDMLPPTEVNYTPVDYAVFMTGKAMLGRLLGRAPLKGLHIAQRLTGKPRDVSYSPENGLWIAVNQNRDDLETLTIDLEQHDEATETRLRRPIENFYLLSLIAGRILVAENLINTNGQLPNPKAGETEINTENDLHRQQEINVWRTAAGLAIMAVGTKRPRLRYDMRTYVNNVLAGRLQYLESLERLAHVTGIVFPDFADDEASLSSYLIGVCNPAYISQLREMTGGTVYNSGLE